uniref:Uncharacterized protein n=2 Tax=Caenorhabditis japonica TaxID=281687 RepID=A0A8R1E9B4_CAEJA
MTSAHKANRMKPEENAREWPDFSPDLKPVEAGCGLLDRVVNAASTSLINVAALLSFHPNCLDAQSRPLIENGLPHLCSRPEDPCHRQGYTCQESDIDEVFVCCTARSPPIVPSVTTTFPSLFKTTSNSVVLIPDGTVKATCPFSYMPPKNDQGEGQRCLTLFSFDCPFGYTCLPSSTTDSYLCCIRKPVI